MKKLNFLLLLSILLILFNSCEKDETCDEQDIALAILETNLITNITATSAISGGNITDDGGSSIITRGVCWSKNQIPTINDHIKSNGSISGMYTCNLENLESNTTYYVRAFAINSKGTSYGDELSFKTQIGENIYFGYVTLTTQQEVDDFGSNNYTEIRGNLEIGEWFTPSYSIVDLSSLSSLNLITGYLRIVGTDALTNLTGLNNITYVDLSLSIYHNTALTSLTGLDNINSVNLALNIEGNTALTSLSGLDNLSSVGENILIQDNPSLASLSGLENMTTVNKRLNIWGNNALTSLSGLDNITSVGENLDIYYNPVLTSLSALENITTVDETLYIWGNNSLTSLTGLDNITSVGGDLEIRENDSLTDLCGIRPIFLNNGLVGNYSVSDNAYNPTEQNIIDGNCSQ